MICMDGLATMQLFAGVEPGLMAQIESIATLGQARAGEIIFEEKHAAKDIYLLVSGTVTLSFGFVYQGQNLAVNIKKVRPGELLGWSALTSGQTLSARATADTDVAFYTIPAAKLREVMDREPRLGYLVMDRVTDLASRRLLSHREELRALLGM